MISVYLLLDCKQKQGSLPSNYGKSSIRGRE